MLATTHVHASCCRFIYRTVGWRSALTSGRHAVRFHEPRIPEGTRCHLVFGVVAFPPPPVTSPATRLKSEDLSDFCYPEADHFLRARRRFYPRRSGRALRPLPKPSLSASAWGVIAATAACRYSQSKRHRLDCLSPRWSRRP